MPCASHAVPWAYAAISVAPEQIALPKGYRAFTPPPTTIVQLNIVCGLSCLQGMYDAIVVALPVLEGLPNVVVHARFGKLHLQLPV